jgi:8-oxo-dGTP pyrophosphatase MutT (NUDIX family)
MVKRKKSNSRPFIVHFAKIGKIFLRFSSAAIAYFYLMTRRFNVRVYGILIENGRVLVSDEHIREKDVTKFPGGGLEFGEGTLECVAREFMEELNLSITEATHFYTTDFFVQSAFDPGSQVISIYYKVKSNGHHAFTVSNKPFDYERKEDAQSLRWISLDELKEDDLTLIIDKKVAQMLIDELRNG